MRNVFTYFMLFFIYAILGWIIETTLVSIEKRKFVNRGFLIGLNIFSILSNLWIWWTSHYNFIKKLYQRSNSIIFDGSNNMWNIRVFYKLHNGKNI